MRVAVTGATGRLGSALVAALADAPFTGPLGPIAWDRAAFDLDAPDGVGARLDRDRPEVVVHAAAWTDVDGCARDPDLALRRNGESRPASWPRPAPRAASTSSSSRPTRCSTGRGPTASATRPTTRPAPANPYGASKLAGERAATEAFDRRRRERAARDRPDGLAVRRPGPRLPAQDPRRRRTGGGRRRAAPRRRRRVGHADLRRATSPTRSSSSSPRTRIGGHPPPRQRPGSRPAPLWARVRRRRGSGSTSTVDRRPGRRPGRAPSTPPRWGVLAPTPLPSGEPLRPWPRRDGRLRADPGPPARERPMSLDRAAVGARRRPVRRDRPVRRRARLLPRAVASQRVRADRRRPRGRRRRHPRSSRRTSRPRPPGVLRGLHLHRRQLDYWVVGERPGASSPSSTCGRCSTGGRRAGRRDA